MSKRRKKKIVRPIHPSPGPLSWRLAGHFPGQRLVFSDASLQRHGGLAAVLFADEDSEPLLCARTVAPRGSNALELLAALFALEEAGRLFPGQAIALFSDNQPAVERLQRAWAQGLADDPELAALLAERGIVPAGRAAVFRWVPGHASCRGNLLADQLARGAAA